MNEVKVMCPHCGRMLYFIINETGGIALRSFDISENSETLQILRSSGYEFGGAVRSEGGENGDE